MPGPDGTDGWYKLPVDSTNPNPEVDLSFRADSSWDGASGVEFNAGATETATGETDWAIPSGGEEATPADDGAFAHRMEEVDGARDFSGVSDDLLVHGGGGDDTIVGGQGDDTLSGGAGNDVIHATAGSNLIIGGAGNDTLYGGEGEDVFFWDAAHFGSTVSAHDVVWDFEYGKDMLQFGDVFGDEMDVSVDGILDLLNNDKGGFTDNSLSLEGDSFSLTAQFTEDGVSLHINKDGAEQTIDVNFDGEGAYTPPMSAEQAAEILNGLIGNGLV